MTTDREPAFWAAYEALTPYTQHAQIRAEIANLVVDTLANYHLYAAVEVLSDNWPAGITRINRECLTTVVLATAKALEATR